MDKEGKTKVEHWLYSSSYFSEVVEEETDCAECTHVMVCKHDMERFCINFELGTSQGMGGTCQQCIHRFTKYDNKQPIPCFRCKFFKGEENE